ncbi:transposase [Gordonia sputi]|uniref:transposase n=1 Tax=Gordonia sputi TaxID=36823 RepID=UPI00227009C2|nr:transposase [Gordonia sputi]
MDPRLDRPETGCPASSNEDEAGSTSRGNAYDRLFDTGIAHLHHYAAMHGSSSPPRGATIDGFAIGQWVVNRRAEYRRGHLSAERIPDLNPKQVEQPTLFDSYRHHAFFTTTDKQTMGTVAADKTHRGHAIIEQVHADLKAGPLAHLPSGVFTANSAWLVLAVIAFNLTRAAGLIADRGGRLARATTATIRRTLISVPARLARTARRIILHLPDAWPWQTAFDRLFTATHAPPPPAAAS